LEETGVVIGDVRFVAVTNDLFLSEQRHYLTAWVEASFQSGDAHIAYPDKVAEVAWVAWDALPDQLFLPFQNLLSGRAYPQAPRFSRQLPR
jgi:8-oxo-dGTP diphosphatase